MEGDVAGYVRALTFCIIAAAALWLDLLMPEAYGLAEAIGPDGSNAQAVHELGQTGQGVNVGLIAEDNARDSHEAFADSNGISHLFNYDFSGDGISISSHDTWMAGVVASRGGTLYPDDMGLAPGVDIYSARVVENNDDIYLSWLENALEELVNNQDCRVIVTGIALSPSSIIPDGQSQWTRLYDYYAYHHNVVFANAAANAPTRILVFGDAYNGITTGGLRVTNPDVTERGGTLSGAGPTDDGRRKPDTVAPSQNQTVPSGGSDTSWYTWTAADGATSFSVPHTAGIAALLLGLADETINLDDNQNEVIKAVIINSTFPNINDRDNSPTNPADPNNVWHSHRGYGRTDALRAYKLLDADQCYPDTDITQQKGWAYETINSNGSPNSIHTYKIHALKNYRLVLTVTWNRLIDKNGTYTEEGPPKFNLDLTITGPDEQTLFGETGTADNLEKVDLILPDDGIYEITLENTSPKQNRSYAFAFELLPPVPGDFDPVDYIVDYADMTTLAQQWLLVAPNLEADLFVDDANTVNMPDFAEFTSHWLETDPLYYQQ